MRGEHTAYIALGSNLGEPERNLRRAVASLDALEGCKVVAESRPGVYPAQGGPPGQPDYLNMAVRLATRLDAFALLEQMQAIEASMGRPAPHERPPWASRIIDLDLIFFDEVVIVAPDLVVPHPRMHTRRFVLEPLAEIGPDVRHPVLGLTTVELLERLNAQRPARSDPSDKGSTQ